MRAANIVPYREPVVGFEGNFLMLYREYLTVLPQLSGSEIKVLLGLLTLTHGYRQSTTRHALSARELAESWGVSENSALAALRTLKEKGLIAPVNVGGPTVKRQWRVCPPSEWHLDAPSTKIVEASPAQTSTRDAEAPSQEIVEAPSKTSTRTAEGAWRIYESKKDQKEKETKEKRAPGRTRSRDEHDETEAAWLAEQPEDYRRILTVLHRVPTWRIDYALEINRLQELMPIGVGLGGSGRDPLFLYREALTFEGRVRRNTYPHARLDMQSFHNFVDSDPSKDRWRKWQADQRAKAHQQQRAFETAAERETRRKARDEEDRILNARRAVSMQNPAMQRTLSEIRSRRQLSANLNSLNGASTR